MKSLKELMTHPIEVGEPTSTLAEIAELMREEDTGAIPIVENGKPVGMITDRDIVVRTLAQDVDPNQVLAQDIMSQPVICCYDDEDIHVAAKLMEEKQVRRLLVLDQNERIVGMLSLSNIAAWGGDIPMVGHIIEKVTEPSHHPRI